MKKIKLNKEERSILKDFNDQKFESVPNVNRVIKSAQLIAKRQLVKDANISIRLNSSDLKIIKTKAQESGLPYQTLISTLIHHYASGKIGISL